MEFNRDRNLLRKSKNHYELINCKEPNLYREMFPYSEVPKIVFDDQIVTFDMPEEIWITDTTFRDGQQSRPPFTVEQIVQIYKYLHKLSGPNGVIRQSEFFLYSDKDKKAVEEVLALGYRFPEVTGWIRAVKEDFNLVKQMGLKETGILTSVSDYHIFLKLKKSRQEAMDKYIDIVAAALENGIIPRCHFEDITRADIPGFVIPFAQKLMEMSEDAKMPIKIRLCDTMGYGTPYPGSCLPRGIGKLAHYMKNEAGVPSEYMEWHGHNDFHKVHVNTVTAWLHGVCGANGTIFGFGERTGNSPIEGLIMEYISLTGGTNGIDTTIITEMANYFRKELDFEFAKNQPFVGEDFNVTRAGIHADGVVKNEEIYNIFDTDKLLNRPLGVSITDKSGTAGIIHWLYNKFPESEKLGITKKHPKIIKIYELIVEEYNNGRTTSISDQEMHKYIATFIPGLETSLYDKFRKKLENEAVYLIEEIASKNDVKSLDRTGIEKNLIEYADNHPSMKLLYVTNTDGKKITKNVTQIEDRKLYESSLLEEIFSDRDWFINPMKDGSTHISDVYLSKITNKLSMTVSAPIFNDNDKIIGIVGIDFNFDDFAKELN